MLAKGRRDFNALFCKCARAVALKHLCEDGQDIGKVVAWHKSELHILLAAKSGCIGRWLKLRIADASEFSH